MPPYEPKTDSKEFELLNAGQESSSTRNTVLDATDITIRLWEPQRSGPTGSLNWKTESVLVYMIADLVAASGGRVDESSAGMTAVFDSVSQALVAAKRIQTAIFEFLATRQGRRVSATILVHPPADQPSGLNAQAALGALHLAEAGQIFLSQEISNRVRGVPGIELRGVPALTTGGSEHVGLSELVWVSPDRIAQWQASVGARDRAESAPMGATMIVNSVLASPREERGKTAQTVVGTTGLLAPDQTATTRSRKLSSEGSTAGDFRAGGDTSFQPGVDESQPTSLPTRTRLIIGAAAIVLAGFLAWEFYPRSVSKPVVHVQEDLGNQTPQTAQPQPPALEPKTTEPEQKEPTVVVNSPAKPPVNRHPSKPPALVPPPTVTEQPPAEAFVDGFFQKDIPRLLQMAKADAGSGNYDKARREYRIVQRLQPNNPDAKEGLRRLDVAQSDSQ